MSDLNSNIGLTKASTGDKVAAYAPLVAAGLPTIACLLDKNACPQPTTNVTNITSDANKTSGLSTGAIIGIVAGGVAFLAIIIVIVVVVSRKK